jgi:hypothetical protein
VRGDLQAGSVLLGGQQGERGDVREQRRWRRIVQSPHDLSDRQRGGNARHPYRVAAGGSGGEAAGVYRRGGMASFAKAGRYAGPAVKWGRDGPARAWQWRRRSDWS